MATSTLTPTRPSPSRSSIGLKIVMAISGLYFVFFVLFHMYGNLKILISGVAGFDDYAHHLREMFVPILPYSGFLWLFRLSLILAVVLHVWSASTLWARANGARRTKYSVKSTVQRTLSSQAMRWGGITLLLFILFHLAQFTVVKFTGDGRGGGDFIRDGVQSPGLLLIASFQIWWVFVIYLLAMIALGLHLHHGTWSAFQTLGLTNTAKARATAKGLGLAVAAVVVLGFLVPPFLILVGVIK
ncbi:MAG: succinate dehydrogenase cytochrome b subunit [Austwickia sp.]|nr:succinate dehydrogenase cytochrome b subunit [Actinomycetota bacterium]MCO5310292.1 succinate dehydrogenase cytochrome b subunit [Austwickia sp.]